MRYSSMSIGSNHPTPTLPHPPPKQVSCLVKLIIESMFIHTNYDIFLGNITVLTGLIFIKNMLLIYIWNGGLILTMWISIISLFKNIHNVDWVLVFIPKTCRESEVGLSVIFEGAGQGRVEHKGPQFSDGVDPHRYNKMLTI